MAESFATYSDKGVELYETRKPNAKRNGRTNRLHAAACVENIEGQGKLVVRDLDET